MIVGVLRFARDSPLRPQVFEAEGDEFADHGRAAAFAAMTTSDPKSRSGLSPAGESALAAAKDRLCRQIESESHSMTLDRLTMLLGGGPGAGIVGEAMLEIALDQLFPPSPAGS